MEAAYSKYFKYMKHLKYLTLYIKQENTFHVDFTKGLIDMANVPIVIVNGTFSFTGTVQRNIDQFNTVLAYLTEWLADILETIAIVDIGNSALRINCTAFQNTHFLHFFRCVPVLEDNCGFGGREIRHDAKGFIIYTKIGIQRVAAMENISHLLVYCPLSILLTLWP